MSHSQHPRQVQQSLVSHVLQHLQYALLDNTTDPMEEASSQTAKNIKNDDTPIPRLLDPRVRRDQQ